MNVGLSCEIGLRTRTYHVLSGSVLSVWNKVEMVLGSMQVQTKMQIIRLRTDDNQRIVGMLFLPCYFLNFEVAEIKSTKLYMYSGRKVVVTNLLSYEKVPVRAREELFLSLFVLKY